MKNALHFISALTPAALLFFLLSTSSPAHSAAPGQKNRFIPPQGKTILIVGQDIKAIDEYVKSTGKVPGGLTLYTSVQRAQGVDGEDYNDGGVQNFPYILKKYPNTVIQIGLWMVDALDEVYTGGCDANIDKLGKWIKNSRRPVYLRLGFEFDFPDNRYDPYKYIKAFRYIVDRYNKQGIRNVAYVWHSFANQTPRPVTDWYPGDNYVDWVAVSFFTKDQMSYIENLSSFAKKHRKPFMIAESTPFNIGTTLGKGSWSDWFIPYFNFISKNDVKIACYINCNWDELPNFQGQNWGDSRVQADAYVKQQWLQEIKKPRYLQAAPGLFQALGYSGK
jgi:hypothetical protein